jgi:hypothetical protein
MASRDLQLVNDPPIILESSRASSASATSSDSPELTLVLDVIRKRWWLLTLCLLLSGPTAYFTAMQFGKQSAVSHGNLMYTGLPLPPGPAVYQAPSLATYKEILFSTPNLQRICDRHGLEIPPSILTTFFECTIRQGSSIMELSLTWPNAEDGIDMLNDTMQLLIDEAARQRSGTLLEYMKHVEVTRLEAKSELDKAQEQLRLARRKQDERLSSGGLTGGQYTSALERVTNTQAALDTLQVNQLGVEQRIGRLDDMGKEIIGLLRKSQIDARTSLVKQLVKPYSKGSPKWTELSEIYSKLSALSKEEPPLPQDYLRWKSGLAEIGRGVFPDDEKHKSADIGQLENQLQTVLADREKLELDRIPIANQAALLEKRLAAYERQAGKLADDITGIGASDIEDYEKLVDSATQRANLYQQQLDNMRNLEECRTREFSISMPASMKTTKVESNKKKLFVLSFAATAVLLCAPVFGLEWLAQRKSPVARFADRWGLPVIAERLLSNYSADAREPRDWRTDEAVRMTTLRIQQCMSRPGCVVLFSSLGKTPAPVQLMSSIAACLAHREERVLIVDAIDPTLGKTLSKGLSDSRESSRKHLKANGRVPSGAALAQTLAAGLSEYFSRECDGAADLIQPTACPGVDLISSGAGAFPREAMASSCVTELFDHCRKTYSIILVAGPPVVERADFQMLAARADAILLGATRAAVYDPVSRDAVQDLIDLRAPVIGIVA